MPTPGFLFLFIISLGYDMYPVLFIPEETSHMTTTLKYILTEKNRVLMLRSVTSFTPLDMIQWFRDGGLVYLVVDDTVRWFTIPLSFYVQSFVIDEDTDWYDCITTWTSAGIWPIGYNATNQAHHLPIPRFVNQPTTLTTNVVGISQSYLPDDPLYQVYRTPKVCGCDHDGTIATFYGNPTSIYPVTRPFWKFHKDIVFSSTISGGASLNFANCIPICGGIAYTPEVHDDQLYAKDAVFSTWPTYRRNLNYFLIDFTPVGGLSIVKFSDCTVEVHKDWVVVTLPNDVVTTNKSLLVTLFGRIMLANDQIRRTHDRIIMIPISLLQSRGLGLNYRRTTERTVRNTMALYEPTEAIALVNNLKTQSHHFLTIVNTAKLYEGVLHETMRLTNNVRRFPRGARGLVRNVVTGHIQDYALLDFNSDTIIIAQDERPLLVPKGQQIDHPMQRVGMLHTRAGYDKFHNLHDSPWCMFEWMTTEELIQYAT
jgi:hypothetical protein